MRIAIIGYSGSGKSTLAKYLGAVYEIPVLYLDRVHFLSEWKERKREESVAMVSEFMKQESWVIDGNYSNFLQKQRLEQADHIIFMRFPRRRCMIRVYKRFLKNRNRSRESMADGCIEKLNLEFVWWILYKGRTKKKRDHYHMIEEQYKDKTTVLKSQRQLTMFMQKLFEATDCR